MAGVLKPGDHIYSWRTLNVYAHHGIYVGNGNVIHFTTGEGQGSGSGMSDLFSFRSSSSYSSKRCPRCGYESRSHGVILSCLECFLSGGEVHVFQYGVSLYVFLFKASRGTCACAPCGPPEDAVQRAEYFLKNGFGSYNIVNNNCMDFAIYCKTGVIYSTNLLHLF